MDIGISTFPTDYSADIALVAKKAEELGFESMWVPEHIVLPAGDTTPWPGSADGVIPKVYADIVDPFVKDLSPVIAHDLQRLMPSDLLKSVEQLALQFVEGRWGR